MHFGENQLSRSLIGLSPLPTAHPPGFQPRRVRSSTRSYTRLNLAMGRSPRFGSAPRDCTRPVRTRSRYGYPTRVNLATQHDSQAHSSIGTPPPHPHPPTRGAGGGSDGSQAPGFRYSFTPLPGYFSPFPHGTHPLSVIRKYSGSQVVLADSHRIPRAPCYHGNTPHATSQVPPTGLSPTTARHPRRFSYPAIQRPPPRRG